MKESPFEAELQVQLLAAWDLGIKMLILKCISAVSGRSAWHLPKAVYFSPDRRGVWTNPKSSHVVSALNNQEGEARDGERAVVAKKRVQLSDNVWGTWTMRLELLRSCTRHGHYLGA